MQARQTPRNQARQSRKLNHENIAEIKKCMDC